MLIKRILFKIYKKYRIYFNTNNGIGIGKIYPINKIIKKCKLVLKPDFCYVQGHKIFLDKTDSLDLSINGIYGVLETNIIKNEIAIRGCFFEIPDKSEMFFFQVSITSSFLCE